MWNIISARLEIMLVSVAQKSFWTHPIELQGDVDNMDLVLVHLETVFVSVQDRCTVCVERTISS